MDGKADQRLPVVGVVFLVRLKGARNNRRRNLKRSSDAAKQMLASPPSHTPRTPVRFKHIGLIAAQRSHASHAASPVSSSLAGPHYAFLRRNEQRFD